jgi:predicted XRE-type DNA-binding protein
MENINYSFPPLEDLKEMRKKRGTVNVVLPENATFLEKVKYEIVQTILAYQQDNNLSYEETSHRIGLPLTQTMEILRGNITAFTLDSLISCAEHLHLPLQVKITTENEKGMGNQMK